MTRALLGVGANLGDRAATLARVVEALRELPHTQVVRTSSLYETAPVGYADQPDFLNAVIELKTGLSAYALLGACLGIEAALGRRRTFPNAPRVADVDVLRYGTQCYNKPELVLPHPRMAQRAFVLVPLAELFPDRQVDGWDFSKELQQVSAQAVRRVGCLCERDER